MQVLGALLAAVFLMSLVPDVHKALLGVTVPGIGVQAEQGKVHNHFLETFLIFPNIER